jgi:hypothetical protein
MISSGAVAVCCVCFVWNAVKIHLDPAAQCSTTGRRQPLALAAMITAAVLSALESAASIYSLRCEHLAAFPHIHHHNFRCLLRLLPRARAGKLWAIVEGIHAIVQIGVCAMA